MYYYDSEWYVTLMGTGVGMFSGAGALPLTLNKAFTC